YMVEFGFWLGDNNNFDHPTFFVLPYPFVSGQELEVTEDFPTGSYFSGHMAEYLLEIESELSEVEQESIIQFFNASFVKSAEYLNWQDREYCFKELKIDRNYRNNNH